MFSIVRPSSVLDGDALEIVIRLAVTRNARELWIARALLLRDSAPGFSQFRSCVAF
jgi:hypothetical protein